MRPLALCICAAILVGCSHAITSSPLPANPAYRNAMMPFATGQTIFSFSGPQGANPEANLIAVKGALYGTTNAGGTGTGVVFRITPSGALKVLHKFGKSNDGFQPGTGPLIYVKGELYGVTTYGGTGNGVVYKITTTGKERVVYRFKNPPDGDAAYGGLVFVNGYFYGTTSEGGTNDYGTVFRLSLSGKETVLHSFKGGKDGQAPFGGLVAVGRTLYGTTRDGGAYTYGTVFKISLSGQEKVIHAFGGTLRKDGGAPLGGLTLVKGQLYGTTYGGGTDSLGTVYAITTAGKERVLHSFTNTPDGGNPEYVNLVNVKGTLYGTTSEGGTAGTVFKITTSGSESVVYNIPGGSGGEQPYGGVAFLNGKLYGTTRVGGNSTLLGTVFSVTP
jgi:uncharacterized repeat protein (TIGR03803 family)